jgi:hypothetical protein
VPQDGDAGSIDTHRQAVRTKSDDEMCGNCHRGFLGPDVGLPHHFPGMDELGTWQRSIYSGTAGLGSISPSPGRTSCTDCHMQREAAPLGDRAAHHGRVASHRFLGGHTWLAAMTGDEDQLARQRAFVAAVDLHLVVEKQGTHFHIEAIVDNQRTGHHFPGGVRDMQDTWLEVVVVNEHGDIVASSGQAHRDDPDDDDAHVFRVAVGDPNGSPVLDHRISAFRAPLYDTTIPPRGTQIVGYRVGDDALPGPGPYRVEARILHRSRNLTTWRATCQAGPGPAPSNGPALDPCPPPPITEVARATLSLADGAITGDSAWTQYLRGKALLSSVQEHVGDANGPLLQAETLLARQRGEAWRRAAVALLRGRLAARQGLTADAMKHFATAARFAPGHPAIAMQRGLAYERVWKWQRAADAYREVAETVEDNDRVWLSLAKAESSLGNDRAALIAANRGLALSPRDANLLRLRALSLSALGREREAKLAARDFEKYRGAEFVSGLKLGCGERSASCAREQQPVHVHALAP